MNFELDCREHDVLTREITELLEAEKAATFKHATLTPLVEELTALVRDLHQLLQSYAPQWYTEQMETRVSETLNRTECALRKTR